MPDVFQTMAELSIGLAGFSAIVIARRSHSETYFVRIILTNALLPGFVALSAPVAVELGLTGDAGWRSASLIFMAIACTLMTVQRSRITAGESAGLDRGPHIGSWLVGFVPPGSISRTCWGFPSRQAPGWSC